jgi:hypothetical protein
MREAQTRFLWMSYWIPVYAGMTASSKAGEAIVEVSGAA